MRLHKHNFDFLVINNNIITNDNNTAFYIKDQSPQSLLRNILAPEPILLVVLIYRVDYSFIKAIRNVWRSLLVAENTGLHILVFIIDLSGNDPCFSIFLPNCMSSNIKCI